MITEKDIEKLAELSRIELVPAEKAALMKEIGSILSYVDQIKSADVKVDAAASVGAMKNVMRPDEARPISAADREAILAEAPAREGDFVVVKKILS